MRILVTAGPTREPIDPVRFLSNRSTGKMGYAIAEAGAERGHDVLLISGPVSLQKPASVRLINVITAAEMQKAVRENVNWCQALVMAAAVADWRPRTVYTRKLKKNEIPPELRLERTPDILSTIRDLKKNRLYAGFAAETENLISEASRKLEEKGLDLIVANDVSRPDSGFEVDTNKVTLLTSEGMAEELPVMSKREVANRILNWIENHAKGEG